jgi:hypothetical protein
VAFRSVPRPSSPPGAKASTKCPSLARGPTRGSRPRPSGRGRPPAGAPHPTHTTPLAPAGRKGPGPAQAGGPGPRSDTRPPDPETHQTLIHPDKDHRPGRAHAPPGPARHPARDAPPPVEAIGLEPTTPCVQGRRSPTELRPPPKGNGPGNAPGAGRGMGRGGLEPPTPRLSSVCSDRLSYQPTGRPPGQRPTRRGEGIRWRRRQRPPGRARPPASAGGASRNAPPGPARAGRRGAHP